MPPWRAALRLPPTASTCQPKRVWRNITKTSAATTTSTQKPTGSVKSFSKPIQSQTSSMRAEVEICTSCACEASV